MRSRGLFVASAFAWRTIFHASVLAWRDRIVRLECDGERGLVRYRSVADSRFVDLATGRPVHTELRDSGQWQDWESGVRAIHTKPLGDGHRTGF